MSPSAVGAFAAPVPGGTAWLGPAGPGRRPAGWGEEGVAVGAHSHTAHTSAPSPPSWALSCTTLQPSHTKVTRPGAPLPGQGMEYNNGRRRESMGRPSEDCVGTLTDPPDSGPRNGKHPTPAVPVPAPAVPLAGPTPGLVFVLAHGGPGNCAL